MVTSVYPTLRPVPRPAWADSPRPEVRRWAGAVVEKVRAAIATGGLRFYPQIDRYTEETQEIRDAYRLMLRDPVLSSAHSYKVDTVASLEWQVLPEDKADPRQQEQAEFFAYAADRVEGGKVGIVDSIARGGLLDGFSVCNWTAEPEREYPRYRGKLALDRFKAKDTRRLQLTVDAYRNVTGVRSFGWGEGGRLFDPEEQLVIYSHSSLFHSPSGVSDHRAAYGAWQVKDVVRKLWALHLDKFTSPALKGTYRTPEQKAALEEELEHFRGSTWLTIPEGVLVEAIQVATRGESEYQAAVEYYDKQMLIAVTGAYLQVLEGQVPDGRGNTQVSKSVTDIKLWRLTADVQRVINEQLVRPFCRLNYSGIPPPKVVLGAVSTDDILKELQVDEAAQKLGFRVSRKGLADRIGRQEAADDADTLKPDQGGGGSEASLPGGPGGGGGGGPPSPFGQGGRTSGYHRFADRGYPPDLQEGLDWHCYAEDCGCADCARWRAHCQEGENAGKPGPCPEGSKEPDAGEGGRLAALPSRGHRFEDPKQADAWGLATYEGYPDPAEVRRAKKKGRPPPKGGLSTFENDLLRNYALFGYTTINDMLRTGKERSPVEESWVQTLDGVLARNATDRPLTAHRSAASPQLATLYEQALAGQTGTEIVDRAYGSTSLVEAPTQRVHDREKSPDKVWLEVHVPAGTPSMYLEHVTHSGEQELLLPRDSHYRVTGAREENGRRILSVEWVGHGPPTGAHVEAFCQEGPNKGKPGPCPKPKHETARGKRQAAAQVARAAREKARAEAAAAKAKAKEEAKAARKPAARKPGGTAKTAVPVPAEIATGLTNPDLPDGARGYLATSTPEELKALHDYTGGAARRVNAGIREGGAPPASLQPMHAQLQSLFAKNPDLPEPVTVLRGLNLPPDQAEELIAALSAHAEEGTAWTHTGYASTSTDPATEDYGNVTLVIRATNGVDTTPVTRGDPTEREFLLNHNSRFTVEDVEETEPGKYRVTMAQQRPRRLAALPLAEAEAFCQEGPNAGKPGPCPDPEKEKARAAKKKEQERAKAAREKARAAAAAAREKARQEAVRKKEQEKAAKAKEAARVQKAKDEALAAAQAVAKDPAKVTAAQAKKIGEGMAHMTLPELRKLRDTLGVTRAGASKASTVAAIKDQALAKAGQKKTATPTPKPATGAQRVSPALPPLNLPPVPDLPPPPTLAPMPAPAPVDRAQHVTEQIRQATHLQHAARELAKLHEHAEVLDQGRMDLVNQVILLEGRWKDTLLEGARARGAKKQALQARADELRKHADVMRDRLKELRAAHDAWAETSRQALKEYLKVDNPAKFEAHNFRSESDHAQDGMKKATDFLQGVVSNVGGMDTVPGYNCIHVPGQRAFHRATDNAINVGQGEPGVMAHEMAHGLENRLPGAAMMVRQFLRARVGDEQPTSMKEKFGGAYGADEVGRKDDFDKSFGGDQNYGYYAGKIYPSGATEILSMGVEDIYRNPGRLAKLDPEYFALVVGVLRGDIRSTQAND
jgi:hypothetical protein